MTAAIHTKSLTDAAVRSLKPGQTLADAGEFRGLRVYRTKTSPPVFIYRYRSPEPGRPLRQYRIGCYPDVSLSDARDEDRQLAAKRANGICPVAEKSAREAEERAQAARAAAEREIAGFSVADMVEMYLSEYIEDRPIPGGSVVRRGARKRKGQSETRRTLYGDAVRVLGDRAAAEVTSKEVFDLVMEVVERGANVQAGNLLRELMAAFNYAISDRLPDDHVNPCYQARDRLKRKKIRLISKRGTRVLSDSELEELMAWLPGSGYTETQKRVLRLTLMTGCRTGEVCAARWRDIDLDRGVWHLKDTKTGVPRDVQLSLQAVAYLRQIRLTTGDYVCPSQKTKKPIQQKQLTEQAWRMRKAGKFIDLPRWTPHDLRRTVRTGLSRLGCPSEVAEAILGHSRSGIEGTYDLHSYDAECR